MGERRLVAAPGGLVEVDTTDGDPDLAPLVFLHEGLGSIDLWRGFPADLGAALGDRRIVVASRHGHGRSAPARMPRPVTYMHHEADVVLPALVDELGLERPVLIGHSDGASIALLYAGGGHDVSALVCIAPHVFVEPESIAGIEAARHQFETTDLAVRLGRYHDDAIATFRGWNDVWLSPAFRTWNIEDRLPAVAAPVLLVQGTDDQYGTIAQLDAIAAGVSGPCDRMVEAGAGHAPHLDEPAQVRDAIAAFVRSVPPPS